MWRIKTKKRLKIVFTTLLLTSTSTFASLCSSISPSFEGFYAGFGVGASSMAFKLNSQLSNIGVFQRRGGVTLPTATTASYSKISKKDSLLGAIYGGNGFSCAPFYLGYELFAKINKQTASVSNTDTFTDSIASGFLVTRNFLDATQFTMRKVEGSLDARLGILVARDNLLYGRLGVAFNKVTVNSIITSLAANTAFSESLQQVLSNSVSKTNIGFRVGLGMEQMLCDCLAFRFDYIFTIYSRVNLNSSIQNATPFSLGGVAFFNTLADSRTVRPTNHSFMIGITYYYGFLKRRWAVI